MKEYHMNELENILIQIQDHLVPTLDSYEQAIYHYVFRHTYLIGKKQMMYSTRTAEIGFGTGVNAKPPSMKTRSKKIRSLEAKGAVRIIERSNKGILVELILPHEIAGLIEEEEKEKINLDSLDFFKDRRLLPVLLERENFRCFYIGKKITAENCYLDHVIPQSKGGDNTYRNIVATCYDANSMKNDMDVNDFARVLLKEDLLSLDEFNELKKKIKDLQKGNLVLNKETVLRVIS
jgi:hypothetical protein